MVIDLSLVIRSHGHRCFGNRQRARRINHIVVALHGIAGGRDGVGADILAVRTGERVADHAFGIAVLQARHIGRQGGIVVAILLALVNRRHRDSRFVHDNGDRLHQRIASFRAGGRQRHRVGSGGSGRSAQFARGWIVAHPVRFVCNRN